MNPIEDDSTEDDADNEGMIILVAHINRPNCIFGCLLLFALQRFFLVGRFFFLEIIFFFLFYGGKITKKKTNGILGIF